MRRSSLRLAVLGLTGAVAGAAILLGVEVAVVLRRDFLVDVPWDPIHAGLGDVGASELGLVVIGDSTAVGVGTRAEEEAYPTLLARRLAEAGFRVRLDVVAASGARVAAAADLQTPRALSLRPDIVLVVIGANDVTHLTRLSAFRAKMAEMLDELTGAGVTVVVVGTPDMGTTRAFPEPLRSISGWRGSRVQRVIRKEAAARGLPFVDLAAKTGQSFDEEPRRYYSRDWFHPGPRGYELWAEAMEGPLIRAATCRLDTFRGRSRGRPGKGSRQ